MRSRGFVVLTVILLVVLVAAAALFAYVYFGKTGLNNPIATITGDSQVNQLKTLGTSDEVSSIETDLNKTNLEKINQELPQIDKESSNGL